MSAEEGELPRQGLTREELDALLAWLDPDRGKAAVRLLEIRERLVRLFQWRGCETPDDATDETINRVARRVHKGPEIESPDPLPVFCGFANLVGKECRRKKQRERKAIDELSTPFSWPEDPQQGDRLEALLRCLERLPEDLRRLILGYYSASDRIRTRRTIAHELRITLNTLRIRAHRIRKDLERCVQRQPGGDG